MKLFLGLLVAWLALDAFVVTPRQVPARPKVARVVAADWPELPPRKERSKSRRTYGSLKGVRYVHSSR
jgi:hypothetical protein